MTIVNKGDLVNGDFCTIVSMNESVVTVVKLGETISHKVKRHSIFKTINHRTYQTSNNFYSDLDTHSQYTKYTLNEVGFQLPLVAKCIH